MNMSTSPRSARFIMFPCSNQRNYVIGLDHRGVKIPHFKIKPSFRVPPSSFIKIPDHPSPLSRKNFQDPRFQKQALILGSSPRQVTLNFIPESNLGLMAQP